MTHSALDALPSVREVIDSLELRAKKSLGQNFLTDLNLTYKIARHAGDLTKTPVVEIGPGPGALTRALLSLDANVFALELDSRCGAALEMLSKATNRLEVVEADALKFDLEQHFNEPFKIVANLPYNIATPLLIKWLKEAKHLQTMTLMFQKEVAERIVASVNTPHYGRLAIMTQAYALAERVFDIPPQAFLPPPKVTSSVVHIQLNQATHHAFSFQTLEMITRGAFSQRRKLIKKSLKTVLQEPEKMLEQAGINPMIRPQEITVAEYCKLATLVESQQCAS